MSHISLTYYRGQFFQDEYLWWLCTWLIFYGYGFSWKTYTITCLHTHIAYRQSIDYTATFRKILGWMNNYVWNCESRAIACFIIRALATCMYSFSYSYVAIYMFNIFIKYPSFHPLLGHVILENNQIVINYK